MTVLYELGLAEADLGALASDAQQRPYEQRAEFQRYVAEEREQGRPRASGGVELSPAVLESVRGLVGRGMSVEQAMRNHGLDPDARPEPRRARPSCFEVGLNRPICESEEEFDDLLGELAAGMRGPR